MSKGWNRRPTEIPPVTEHDRWVRTFGDAKTHRPKPPKDEDDRIMVFSGAKEGE